MFKRIRKLGQYLIVLFTISVFVGLTVLVIIIAQGGKVTPSGISHTGIIRVTSDPDKDIDVYLDDQKVTLKDKRIQDLDEGEYLVRVEKQGFTSWQKKVTVEEGYVTEIFVSLFPEEFDLDQLTATNIDRAFFSPDGSYVVYIVTDQNSAENGIWKLKIRENPLNSIGLLENKAEKIQDINSQIQSILSSVSYSALIAPNNSKILLSSPEKQLVISLDSGDIIDLTAIENLGFVADEINWYENGDSLIIEKQDSIYRFEVNSRTTNLIHKFQNQDPIYAVNGRIVIFYAKDKYYQYIDNHKTILSISADISLPQPTDLCLSQISDKLLFITTESKLYYVNLDKNIFELGEYSLITASRSGENAILLSKDNHVYNFRGEFIPAKNKTQIEINEIAQSYSDSQDFYSFSADSTKILYKNANDEQITLSILGIYGENSKELIKDNTIIANDYGLTENSSRFVILLTDSKGENAGNNLYGINLNK